MTATYDESWRVGPQETKFYTRTYKASTPVAVIVFLHGAAEHCGRYTEYHSNFAKAGVTVFAFDRRGYGRTALDEEHKSATSQYGKSYWPWLLDDAEWAIEEASKEHSGLSIVLMGASMGGAEVLGLFCEKERATHPALSKVSAVVSTSPGITLVSPPPAVVVFILKLVAKVSPWTLFPGRNDPKQLSRNTRTNAEYEADPLVKSPGSLLGLAAMINQGNNLLNTTYANWPVDKPVLVLHGEADPVNSLQSSKTFVEKLPAKEKTFISYPGAYHELHNEPDGVKEKVSDDVVAFIKAHVA